MIGKILITLLALFVSPVGIVILGVTIISIIDPVGAKMADDADPFGDPYIPFWQHLIFIAVSLMFFVTSYFLFKKLDPGDD